MMKVQKSKVLCMLMTVAIILTMMLPLGAFTASASQALPDEEEVIVFRPPNEEEDNASNGSGYATDENSKLEGDFYYTVSDGEATIAEYVGTATDIVIPKTLGGYNVTTIGSGAFKENTSIKSVSMPNIKTIGNAAFKDCTSLRSVDISSAVTIGDEAFYYCVSLRFGIPESVVSIGDMAVFGAHITSVDSNNQYYCLKDGALLSKDETVLVACSYIFGNPYTVPDTVTVIGDHAFMGYPYKNVIMPNVTEIGYEAFYYCLYLESITMPEVTTIADRAFALCELITEVKMPSVTTLGKNIFDGCTSLAKVELDGIETITNSAFYNCAELKNVSLPNVTTLEFGAFDSCVNLVSVNMPKVTNVGRWAFNNCPSLTDVYMPNVTNIGGLAFGYCTSLKSISAPKLTTVGIRAFAGCALEGVDFTNVTSIGKNAFEKCPNVVIYAPLDSYAHQYAVANSIKFEEISAETIKSVSYKIEDGKIIFTVTTSAGAYNRLKLTTADNLKGSLAVADKYTVNELGHYVWTIKANAPTQTTNYAFDLRSSETIKYMKEYSYCEVEIIPVFKSVSYEITNGKIVFTVTTSAGAYNRMKIANASTPSGSLAVSNSYTVNADGDYVWTIKMNAPTKTSSYIFDLRSSETGKYIKERFPYTVEFVDSIKSVTCRETSTSLVFTVVTRAGDFNRLRCGLSESIADNVKNTNSYTVNDNGDYVWTIKITKPSESTTYYFDLRDSTTNKFIKSYYIFEYVA